MGQHYTLNTVEASAWCNACNSYTMHRVAQRRLQFCIPCWEQSKAESEAKKAAKEAAPKQQKLFS